MQHCERGKTYEKNTVMNGLILMKGEKFKLQLPDMETYYNGKVEYVYMIKEKEIRKDIFLSKMKWHAILSVFLR